MAGVDVVIVNYNAGAYLARAIAALQAQTMRDFRIIIVDNASEDGSLDALPDGAIPVEVVRCERNLGFAAANNLALDTRVSADWVALLNPDAFPEPDWLAALLAAAADHPEFTTFGCRMVAAAAPDRLDGVGDAYHASGLYWRDGHGCPDGSRYAAPREIFSACAAAALYRTGDLREIGGFDSDYFCYGEDVDVGFRLRLAGHRCLYVPTARVTHVGSGITGQDSDFAVYHGHRNLVWNFVKNMPGALFWLCLPAHLLLNVVSLTVFATRGRGAIMWRAKGDAVRGLPAVWKKRRTVQSRRRATLSALWRAMRHGMPLRRCSGG